MDTNLMTIGSMLMPLAALLGNVVLRDQKDIHDFFTLVCAIVTFGCVLAVLSDVGNGTTAPTPNDRPQDRQSMIDS